MTACRHFRLLENIFQKSQNIPYTRGQGRSREGGHRGQLPSLPRTIGANSRGMQKLGICEREDWQQM